jgi:hypothetical protein
LAFEGYTAAGFHAVRAVEAELRTLLIQVQGGRALTKRDWGYYVECLQRAGVDDKLVGSIDQIRKAERNPLMHPEDVLEIDDAVSLWCICQAAINRLYSEKKKRGLV